MSHSQNPYVVQVHFIDGVSRPFTLEDLNHRYPAHLLHWTSDQDVAVSLPYKPSKRTQRKFRILNRDNWSCHYCAKQVTYHTATLDHKIPQADNLVTACSQCNREKDDMAYEIYLELWAERKKQDEGNMKMEEG